MNEARNLKYNGQTVSVLKFNNQTAKHLQAANCHWGKDDFGLKFSYMNDTGGNVISSYNEPLYATGNMSFVGQLQGVDDISEVTISSGGKIKYIPIDNYGYMFYKYDGHDIWPGGNASGLYESSISLSYSGNTITLPFKGALNESRETFIKGLYTSQAIRIPNMGYSGQIRVPLYPLSFTSSLFDSDLELSVKATPDTPEGFFSSLSVTRDGMEFVINYTISAWGGDTYRMGYLNIYNESLVTFFQEYYWDRRIYAGAPIDTAYTTNENLSPLSTIRSYIIAPTAFTTALAAGSHVILPYFINQDYNKTTSPDVSLTQVGSFQWGNATFYHWKPSNTNTPYTLTLD